MRWWDQTAVDISESAEPRAQEPARQHGLARVSAPGAALPSLRPPLPESRASAAPPPSAAVLQVVSQSPTETVAMVGDCLIVIVEKTVSNIGVNSIRRGLEQLESQYEQVGYLSYIEGTKCSSMDARGRQLMADVIGRHTTRIGAAAMVVNGDGFRSTVVRSLLTGIHLASRARHPLRAFSTVEPALAWYEQMRPRRKLARAALREALLELHPAAAEGLR
jgi:hypothetical protein